MLRIWLRCDLRSPPFGTSNRDLARIAVEQAEWADQHGFEAVQLPEHHGVADGYDPSPFVLGAAIAARTRRMRIHPSAVLLPLHDPVRVAEDTAVLDNVSGGRVDLTIGLGYVPSEFALYGVSLKDRARLVEEKLDVLRRALSGERFEYKGRQIFVTPRPVQQPTPPLYIGGAVPAAAKRAARMGDGFLPTKMDGELRALYIEECRKLGKPPGPIVDVCSGPQFIFVSEDPEAAWAQIAPHAVYETHSYGKLAEATGTDMPWSGAATLDIAALQALGIYRVVTPDECVALAHSLAASDRVMIFNAMLAGLPEKLSWSSLELFASKVLPRLPLAGTQR
jgi:alkanesulfonate monooxygenase SsuD/methylene tetrahydromethanopterin reductase-like flavin-dependent oxidoreductase (luciferase family)